jgi:hypothetical protein
MKISFGGQLRSLGRYFKRRETQRTHRAYARATRVETGSPVERD